MYQGRKALEKEPTGLWTDWGTKEASQLLVFSQDVTLPFTTSG